MSENVLRLGMSEIGVDFCRMQMDELLVTPAKPQKEQEQSDSEYLKLGVFDTRLRPGSRFCYRYLSSSCV